MKNKRRPSLSNSPRRVRRRAERDAKRCQSARVPASVGRGDVDRVGHTKVRDDRDTAKDVNGFIHGELARAFEPGAKRLSLK